MKERILNFFKSDRTYTSGMKLYNEIGPRLSLKRQFNSMPESELKGILFDELRQLSGISMDEFSQIIRNPVLTFPVQTSPAPKAPAKLKTVKVIKTVKKAKGTKRAAAKKVVTKTPAEVKK